MKLFFKRLVYQWNGIREERRYKRMLKQLLVVVDTPILLEREEFKRLLQFRRVIVPHAVFEHLKGIKHRGLKKTEDEEENDAAKNWADDVLQIIRAMIDTGKKKYTWDDFGDLGPILEELDIKEYAWDIAGSYGTGLKSELARIKLEELNPETLEEVQRKKRMDVSYIRLGDHDVLGSPYDRKLRVLAAAKAIQRECEESGKKMVLATRDINMLAIAEDEKLGRLIAIPSLAKRYLLDERK
ncbi:PIN domain-containing protein [Patescibacteria group bacterium AH-259-L07]|nr:PIN domain-containing protein [Patescibacteria group bacterium AH-259-L07]